VYFIVIDHLYKIRSEGLQKGWFLIVKKLNATGFSLVETLVAAAIVCFAIISVLAFVLKGSQLASVEKHRREAREIVDTTLEGLRFLPEHYDSIPATIASDNVTLASGLTVTRSITIGAGTIVTGVDYKTIDVRVKWQEPGATVYDSVQIVRWVPDIPDSLRNIAQSITNIVASSTAGGSAASNAIDGIIGLNTVGDWVSTQTSPNMTLTWATAHTIKRIVLYDRTGAAFGRAGTATVNLNDGKPNITMVIPAQGSKTADFIPRTTSQIQINLAGSGAANVGLAEVEVYE
jgi:hypothetical protein